MFCNENLTQMMRLAKQENINTSIHFDDADEYFCKELKTLYQQFIDCSSSPEDNDVMLINILNLTKNWIEMKCDKLSMSDVNDVNNKQASVCTIEDLIREKKFELMMSEIHHRRINKK